MNYEKIFDAVLNATVIIALFIFLGWFLSGCANRPDPDYRALYLQCQHDREACQAERVECLKVLYDLNSKCEGR